MKLLMIYAQHFGYKTALKTLETVEPKTEEKSISDAVIGFIHVEADDAQSSGKIVTKLIKNLKWLAGKNNTRNIVLHSFSHLSESKADAQVAIEIFSSAEQRLKEAGYHVMQTPMGYFLDLDLKAPGSPLARVFKEF